MMVIEIPERIILQTILDYITFNDKNILEIGCGDGRLTFKFADMCKSVVAIDPKVKDIEKAKNTFPKELATKLTFQIATGEKLPFSTEIFDIVFYTASLCCMTSANSMEESLNEAWRVLKSKGVLINLQPTRVPDSLHVIKKIYQKEKKFVLIAEKETLIRNCWWQQTTEKSVITILRKRPISSNSF